MNGISVLVSPLSWGFGHAGRMIPLVLELKKRGCNVIFAADAAILETAAADLPGIRLVEIPGLRISYSRHLPQYICIFLQLPRIIASGFKEHRVLRRLVRELNPSLIISDNRFGFYNRKVYSVYVTHQLRIPFPRLLRFMEPLASWLHRLIIRRYDLCLVPDFPGEENLSGRLSHGIRLPRNTIYTGPLSRFATGDGSEDATGMSGNPYVCLILTGPEPQRSVLLQGILNVLHGVRMVILSTGPAPDDFLQTHPEAAFITTPGKDTMSRIIAASLLVITRAGYTSVMDLFMMGRGAVLIPTPGQTEQEYIGMHLDGRYGFRTLRQGRLEQLPEIVAGIAESGGNRSGKTGVAEGDLPAGTPDPADPAHRAFAGPGGGISHVKNGAGVNSSFAKALFEKAVDCLPQQQKK